MKECSGRFKNATSLKHGKGGKSAREKRLNPCNHKKKKMRPMALESQEGVRGYQEKTGSAITKKCDLWAQRAKKQTKKNKKNWKSQEKTGVKRKTQTNNTELSDR